MATSLRVEIENATGQGLKVIKGDLGEVANAAHKLGDEMTGAGKASSRSLHDIRDEANDTRKALQATAKSANALGDTKKSVNGLSLQFTGMNQALEIGKKALEVTKAGVLSLAEAGNPAAKSLVDSFGDVQNKLVEIGDDPIIVNTMKSWEGTIKGTVIPAIGKIPGALRYVQDGFAGIVTKAGEFTGFFPPGTTENLKEEQAHLSEIADEQREINEEARKTAIIYGRINDIENKLAEESELNNIAKLKSERSLRDLLELEIENREELAEKGELAGKKLEASDKKIEVIKRQLAVAVDEQAAAEIKAQEDVSAARKKAADEYNQILIDGKAAFDESNAENTDKATERAKEVMNDLRDMIGQAKSILHPENNLVDDLRGQFSGKDVKNRLVDQAKEKARESVLNSKEFIGKVAKDGTGIGDTSADREKNERAFRAAVAKAERQAVIGTNRRVRTNTITGEEEMDARDSLLMDKADKARDAGILGPQQHKALRLQLDSDRSAFGEQQKQAREMFGLQALAGNGPTKEQWENMQIRRGNAAGGVTQGTQDQAMGDVLGTVARGNDNYGRFAQTATQGFAQLSQQFQQQGIQIKSLQQQFEMMMQGNANAAARQRNIRSGLGQGF